MVVGVDVATRKIAIGALFRQCAAISKASPVGPDTAETAAAGRAGQGEPVVAGSRPAGAAERRQGEFCHVDTPFRRPVGSG
ncbi:hypothetical protein JCM9957A_60700 [Kineosporia succinea]|uniref:IS110 family transposase n=1 Tax=Kineosporia succinea TaxID=84632 RepID=A0ABT9P7U8_9ACTN|nr:hypothetical protein [Kineosporia succinea]